MDGVAERLAPFIRRTPLIKSNGLSDRFDRPIYLKLENLQRSGSFKYRPALNSILTQLTSAKEFGVVTSSSGNFAGAVALAAKELQIDATIVMRPSASSFKVDRVKSWGAHVHLCEDNYEAREATVAEFVETRQLIRLHPHDSESTVLGDATVALEVIEQLPDVGSIVVPCSGAGLLGGVALAANRHDKLIKVVGVQPEANGTLRLSLDSNCRVGRSGIETVADGLTAAIPGEIGFALTQSLVDDVVTVSESSLIEATKMVFEVEGQFVEPAGAAGLAAVLEGKAPNDGSPTVLIVTGGNVDPVLWAAWVSR
ncbi:MAG: threonine dehydratase [Planctomycetota bacterium]|jgi:threonine dehydratase